MTEPAIERARIFRVSLQAKILLVVLACVGIPALSMGYYLMRLNERTLGDKVRDGLTNQLFRKATDLEHWLKERLEEDGRRWSSSFAVFESVETLARSNSETAERARALLDLEEFLDRVLGHNRTYESLFVVDREGRLLASTRQERLEEWAAEKVRTGLTDTEAKGVVSPIYRSSWLGHATMLILQPITARRGSAVIGYFIGRLDLREMESTLGTPVDAETAFQALDLADVQELEQRLISSTELLPAFWLLDTQGRIIAESGKISPRPGEELFKAALLDGAEEVAPVREADLAGQGPTVYAVRRLKGHLQGFLAATLPTKDAYKSLEESRRTLLWYGIPGLGLLLGLTALGARRVLRPIRQLSDGARRVSLGEDVFLPTTGHDEIAELTRTFNEMVGKVRESRQRLEEARDQLAQTNEGLREANRTLETLAITDGLTGLYNHRHFQDTIDKEIRRCDREARQLSLLLIDIDHFKQYNDRFGHTEGDAALRRVAGQIASKIRSTDMAFRYGGEEMAVLLPSCSKEQATEVAEKMRVAVAQSSGRSGRFGAKNTISIGVATFPEDGRVARALVDTADAALYEAKARGRDRVIQAGVQVPPTPKAETAGAN